MKYTIEFYEKAKIERDDYLTRKESFKNENLE